MNIDNQYFLWMLSWMQLFTDTLCDDFSSLTCSTYHGAYIMDVYITCSTCISLIMERFRMNTIVMVDEILTHAQEEFF